MDRVRLRDDTWCEIASFLLIVEPAFLPAQSRHTAAEPNPIDIEPVDLPFHMSEEPRRQPLGGRGRLPA